MKLHLLSEEVGAWLMAGMTQERMQATLQQDPIEGQTAAERRRRRRDGDQAPRQ